MKINIKDLKDISIGKYQKIDDLLKQEESFERDLEIVRILTDISKEKLYNMKKSALDSLISIISDSLNEGIKEKNINKIRIKGKKYKFDKKLNEMSTGMFVDLENFTKNEEDIIKNLHIVSAILFRPTNFFGKIKKYDSKTVEERSELFKKHMKMDVAYNLAFFLSNLKIQYLVNIEEYLMEEKENQV